MESVLRLASGDLYHACDLSSLAFATTAELEPVGVDLGQDRAVEAIDLGIGMPHRGYNIYLMGSAGLGKQALVNGILTERRRDRPIPDDWCYVADFQVPSRPRALRLPAGRGGRLRADMRQLVEDLLNTVPLAFQSEEYERRAEAIRQELKAREDAAAAAIGQKAKEHGIALIHTPTGYTLAPVHDDHILGPEEFNALPEEERERIGELIDELRTELQKTLNQLPAWQKEMRQRFKALHRETMERTVAAVIRELESSYADLGAVQSYLAAVKEDILEHGEVFRRGEGQEGKAPSPDEAPFTRYQINLLVDNGGLDGAPVVYEDNPSYLNLIGRIEHIARMGTLVTDFTLIRPGALHHANGGYLVLDALRVLTHPFSWDGLKRVLRSGEIRIEPVERVLSLAGTASLEPQPIPADVKVVLVGERLIYYLLKAYDPDFGQLFKIPADFAEDMRRRPDSDALYARLVATLQQQEGLLALTREAVALVIEEAARHAGDGERLSVHMGRLLDLLREADHSARRKQADVIDQIHVEGAITARRHRLDQLHARIDEEIERGILFIDTQGAQLGRVNALSVIDLGDHAFGVPERISATARLGSGEVLDIQREVEQGGPIHAKGVLILAAYLGRRYARLQPLCLSASLVFEQTYGVVEGDSASLAELCALLSAIGDIPLSQSLAVTGSVNQHGEVQPIGAVNEKIEGFFDVCRARGLTGEQGVIIPHANRSHLMLDHDVVEAVELGKFHVYAVSHADQAMELLTGLPAGVPDRDGSYPPNTINGQIQTRLAAFFLIRQQLSAQTRGEDT